jgi:hypothetical protein
MSIAEIVNERGEVTRIDFWADNKVRVVKSHTFSMMYVLRRRTIKDYLVHNQIIYKGNLDNEVDRRYKLWIDLYFKKEVKQ